MIEQDRRWGLRPCVGMLLLYDKHVLLVRDPPRRMLWDVPQGGIEQGRPRNKRSFGNLRRSWGRRGLAVSTRPYCSYAVAVWLP